MENNEEKLSWKWIVWSVIGGVICLVALGFISFWIGNFFDTLTPDGQIAIFAGFMFLVLWSLVVMSALDSDDDIDSGPGGPL